MLQYHEMTKCIIYENVVKIKATITKIFLFKGICFQTLNSFKNLNVNVLLNLAQIQHPSFWCASVSQDASCIQI